VTLIKMESTKLVKKN